LKREKIVRHGKGGAKLGIRSAKGRRGKEYCCKAERTCGNGIWGMVKGRGDKVLMRGEKNLTRGEGRA